MSAFRYILLNDMMRIDTDRYGLFTFLWLLLPLNTLRCVPVHLKLYKYCPLIVSSVFGLGFSRCRSPSQGTSEPATFVQRLPNVFVTPWAFGTRWVLVVQTSLGVSKTLGSRCTNVAGSLCCLLGHVTQHFSINFHSQSPISFQMKFGFK